MTLPHFSRTAAAFSMGIAALGVFCAMSSGSAHASAVQGKPNAECPQFAPMGFPFPTETAVAGRGWHICHKAYSSFVDTATHGPLWSAELLNGQGLDAEESRTDDFRPDPDIPRDIQAKNQRDFARSGYDQGHLSPAGDFRGYAPDVMSESFYYSNIVPQDADNNRHAWQKLEIFTRQWAQSRGKVYVVTGPIFSGGKALGFLGASKLAIPTHMFKVVTDYERKQSIAFVIPNQPVAPVGGASLKAWEGTLAGFQVTVREVEAWSGLRFDSKMPESERAALHSQKGAFWETRPSRSTRKRQ